MNRVIISDALSALRSEPDESVHLIVTSPPYWGLRSYLPKDHPLKRFEIGCEPTPEEYVAKLVAVFREARRVLRPDGSMWLNLGDSYARNGGTDVKRSPTAKVGSTQNTLLQMEDRKQRVPAGLKEKDLIGIPWMVAFALRSDGWYLRARCPWVKRNGMPESCTDRPTTTVEDMFLLTKSADYFYDTEAVRQRGRIPAGTRGAKGSTERAAVNGVNARPAEYKVYSGTRMRRSSDWFWESLRGLLSDEAGAPLAFTVNTKPFAGAHFATFPPELIKPCILSGTSEAGCCLKCGCPLQRIVERQSHYESRDERSQPNGVYGMVDSTGWKPPTITDKGLEKNCACNATFRPCVVLDPFGGSGTVGEVCSETGRDSILIELNPEYHPLIQQRAQKSPLPSRVGDATVAK